MDQITPLLGKLFDSGLSMGILGVVLYLVYDKLKNTDKAYIDLLSKTLLDVLKALTDATNAINNYAKEAALMSKALNDQSDLIKQVLESLKRLEK